MKDSPTANAIARRFPPRDQPLSLVVYWPDGAIEFRALPGLQRRALGVREPSRPGPLREWGFPIARMPPTAAQECFARYAMNPGTASRQLCRPVSR